MKLKEFKQVMIALGLLIIFGFILIAASSPAKAQMMMPMGGMMGYQNYVIVPDNNRDSRQAGHNVQKIYDWDEKTICYVYVGVGISCVNDLSQ